VQVCVRVFLSPPHGHWVRSLLRREVVQTLLQLIEAKCGPDEAEDDPRDDNEAKRVPSLSSRMYVSASLSDSERQRAEHRRSKRSGRSG
jgi:hypothetical protein